MHFKVLMCLGFLAVGVRQALTALGGQACTIPSSGNPGAATLCTGIPNGFCMLDTLTVTGSPVTAVASTGVCVCYYGYSGPACATADSSTTSSTSTSPNTSNAFGALALGGIGAYLLSQLGGGGSQTALGIGAGPQAAQDAFYLRQSVNSVLGK
ncbi:uncharacterized protein LOC125658019 isoform X1 [Ostrea edulis]|uniref:uncharacterized protein LOC125658019 isoform X1 n=1 Tax=Ostrea edulis TaxID=37623 RepID=UPI0024AF101D|nr:uncharacterized protein LOC125658019 isoform X1 [Ostrea edulis]